jgi:hypothetical protein
MVFSLRSFIVTVILFSNATVVEKLNLMFDLFDKVDGYADGLKSDMLFELV